MGEVQERASLSIGTLDRKNDPCGELSVSRRPNLDAWGLAADPIRPSAKQISVGQDNVSMRKWGATQPRYQATNRVRLPRELKPYLGHSGGRWEQFGLVVGDERQACLSAL